VEIKNMLLQKDVKIVIGRIHHTVEGGLENE
jgi:hypothetical protein